MSEDSRKAAPTSDFKDAYSRQAASNSPHNISSSSPPSKATFFDSVALFLTSFTRSTVEGIYTVHAGDARPIQRGSRSPHPAGIELAFGPGLSLGLFSPLYCFLGLAGSAHKTKSSGPQAAAFLRGGSWLGSVGGADEKGYRTVSNG